MPSTHSASDATRCLRSSGRAACSSDTAPPPRYHRGAESSPVTAFVFATGRYQSGDWDAAPLVPANLIDSVARYTDIDVAPQGVVVPLASVEMLEYPLLYVTGHLPLRFTDAERRNVQKYLDRGGMMFVDDHNHDINGVFHKTATEELTRTAGRLVDVPNTQ